MLVADIQQCSASEDVPKRGDVARWANSAFKTATAGNAEVTIRIVDLEEGAELNRKYRDGSTATNVLSFAYSGDPHAPVGVLGDIVICAPVVTEEALAQGKEPEAHWAHMVVHGVLHLCGFDHEEDEAARTMEALETEILLALGFLAPYD